MASAHQTCNKTPVRCEQASCVRPKLHPWWRRRRSRGTVPRWNWSTGIGAHVTRAKIREVHPRGAIHGAKGRGSIMLMRTPPRHPAPHHHPERPRVYAAQHARGGRGASTTPLSHPPPPIVHRLRHPCQHPPCRCHPALPRKCLLLLVLPQTPLPRLAHSIHSRPLTKRQWPRTPLPHARPESALLDARRPPSRPHRQAAARRALPPVAVSQPLPLVVST